MQVHKSLEIFSCLKIKLHGDPALPLVITEVLSQYRLLYFYF